MATEITSAGPVEIAVEELLLGDPATLALVGENGVSPFTDRPVDGDPDTEAGARADRPMWITYDATTEDDGLVFGAAGNDVEFGMHFHHRHGTQDHVSSRGVHKLFATAKAALCKRGALTVEGLAVQRVTLRISTTLREPARRVVRLNARCRVVTKAAS